MSSFPKQEDDPEKSTSSASGSGVSVSAGAAGETPTASGEQEAQSQAAAGDQVTGGLIEENVRQLSDTDGSYLRSSRDILSQLVITSENDVEDEESAGQQEENPRRGGSHNSWAIDHFWDDRQSLPFGARPLRVNGEEYYTARAAFIVKDFDRSFPSY